MPQRTIPERLYAVGTHTADLEVGAAARGARVRLTRTSSLEAIQGTAAVCSIDVSDDGVIWTPHMRFTVPGGVVVGKDGVTPLGESWRAFTWPGQYVNGVRIPIKRLHVRASMQVVLQAFRTQITVESLD